VGEAWKLSFAPGRVASHRKLCVAPNGKVFEKGWKPDAQWQSGVNVQSDTTATDRWTTNLAIPIASLTPKAASEGKFYANFYRNGNGEAQMLAWTPPFASGFNGMTGMREFDLR